jgi:hypothetical protein
MGSAATGEPDTEFDICRRLWQLAADILLSVMKARIFFIRFNFR